jgi:hypothetical protein
MRELREYLQEFKDIARKGLGDKIKGSTVAWIFMWAGVAFTAPMTYAFCYNGMMDNALWAAWVTVAAACPVLLMEGSAIALVYGRHHWFESHAQRAVASIASWVIWVLLAATSIAHFALRNSGDAEVRGALGWYASYVLPLSIVAVPMLWKHLYDKAPESETRTQVLETEAELKSRILAIERRKGLKMIEAYSSSMETQEVEDAWQELFAKAAIEHAREIAGFIRGTEVEGEILESEDESEDGSTAGSVPGRRSELLIEAGEIRQGSSRGSSGSGGLVNGKAH